MAVVEDYYIKVPTPGGEFTYVRIDLPRLHPGVIRELFSLQKVAGSNGARMQYLPVVGAGGVISDAVDTTELTEVLADLIEQTRICLDAFGESGSDVFVIARELLSFEKIFVAIAEGRTTTARTVLREILYAIMGGTSELAAKLRTAEQTADGMIAAHDHIKDALKHTDTVATDFILDWGIAIQQALDTAKEIERIEGELKASLETVQTTRNHWRLKLAETNSVFRETMQIIDPQDEATQEMGFFWKIMAYRNDPASVPDMKERIRAARQAIDNSRAVGRLVKAEWAQMRGGITNSVLPLKPKIDECVAAITEASRKFNDYAKQFLDGKVAPWEEHWGALVTREQFDAARRIASDPKWGRYALGQRLTGYISSILSLVADEPELPKRVLDLLTLAERQIELIEEDLNEPTPSTQPQLSSSPRARVKVNESSNMTTPVISEARKGELMQLILCVGCVLTDKPPLFAASNTRAMLRVVFHMGRCTENEAEAYSREADTYIRTTTLEDGAPICESVESKDVSEKRRTSTSLWLTYDCSGKAFHRRMLKATERGGRIGRILMEQLGITNAMIKAAHEAKREESKENWEARKRVQTS